jgi:hypothetical protein
MIKTVKLRVEQKTEHSTHALRGEETALLHLLKKRISLAAA